MRRFAAGLVSVACLAGSASQSAAEPPLLVACNELPAAVAALGERSEIEAFAAAPDSSVAIAVLPAPGDGSKSVLRFSRSGAPPREIKLAGHVLGVAISADGKLAYAIVRANDRKGGVRTVDLLRCDLESARSTQGATLPSTARGLALGSTGSILLVASRDEIRTFQLPGLASGPLYRALGDNVGVAPLPGSSGVYLAQPTRIVIADLSAAQTRDGLTLSQEVAAPAPLTGLMASVGPDGPIAISAAGSWCVRNGALPAPPPPIHESQAEAAPEAAAPAAGVPADSTPLPEPLASPAPENVVLPPVDAAPPMPSASAGTGTVAGRIAGPSVAEVEAIVLLGPDNIVHEAARVIPDHEGRFVTSALSPGSYRIVAAGKGGRVLLCDPPFITIRVSSNGAVEAPVLNVMRAQ